MLSCPPERVEGRENNRALPPGIPSSSLASATELEVEATAGQPEHWPLRPSCSVHRLLYQTECSRGRIWHCHFWSPFPLSALPGPVLPECSRPPPAVSLHGVLRVPLPGPAHPLSKALGLQPSEGGERRQEWGAAGCQGQKHLPLYPQMVLKGSLHPPGLPLLHISQRPVLVSCKKSGCTWSLSLPVQIGLITLVLGHREQ